MRCAPMEFATSRCRQRRLRSGAQSRRQERPRRAVRISQPAVARPRRMEPPNQILVWPHGFVCTLPDTARVETEHNLCYTTVRGERVGLALTAHRLRADTQKRQGHGLCPGIPSDRWSVASGGVRPTLRFAVSTWMDGRARLWRSKPGNRAGESLAVTGPTPRTGVVARFPPTGMMLRFPH